MATKLGSVVGFRSGIYNGYKVIGTQTLGLRGLVLWLKFNEGSGNIAYDSSFYNNHGTIYGATWTDGKFGKALSFDGVDDYVEVPDSASLDITDAITIVVWVKFNELGKRNPIVSKSDDLRNYQLEKIENDYLQITFQDPDGNWRSKSSTILQIQDYNWHHVAVTHDSNSGTTFYLDGVSQFISNPYQMGTNDASLKIGEGAGVGVYPINGTIDEVRIYNRALSEEEIKMLYFNRIGAVPSKTI